MKTRLDLCLLIICSVVFMGCATAKNTTQDTANDTAEDTAEGTAEGTASDTAGDSIEDTNMDSKDTDPLSPIVQYLKGQMNTTSPDGTVTYGPPVQVSAKRTIDPGNNTIVEDTWHDQENHKTLATLRPGTLIFDVSDEAKTFEGTITFQTEDWLLGSLTYNINMADGSGTLTGTGVWEGDTYKTNKMFSDPTGTPSAKITETLTIITEEEFLAAIPK